MRKLSIFVMLLIGVFCMGMMVVSADDDDEKAKTKAEVRLGYRAVDTNDALGSVAEYRSLEDSINAAFKMKYLSENAYVKTWGVFENRDDIQARFYADMDRVFQVEANYVEFLHRLDHDPLTNLNAVKTPKVTRSTDYDPGTEYSIVRSEFNTSATFKHPDIPGIMIEAAYNQIERTGHKQARTLSHCANCHVVGYGREIDQITRNYGVKATYNGGQFSISGELSGRTFEERGATPTHTYMDVLHPTKYVPVFNDRVVFGESDGALPFDQTPENSKWKAKLNANVVNESLGSVNGGFVYTEVENDDQGLSLTFNGFHGSWYRKLTDAISLQVKGRYFSMDNDDYFYDAYEPVAVAGPYAGMTYSERWGAEDSVDLNRQSTYNRDVFSVDGNLRYRFAKRSLLSLAYRFTSVDREHFEVTEAGDTETTHNRFKAAINTRLMKGNRVSAEFIYESIDQPFVYLKAAGSKKVDPDPVDSPLVPGSIQYFELYDLHEVDLTARPNEVMSFRGTVKQKLDTGLSVMGGFTYTDKSNDELNMSEWNETQLGVNASLWFALSPEFSGMVTYNYKDSEKDTLFILPIFDG